MSIRPSSWSDVLHKAGKYILAYESHFVAARNVDNEPRINMGNRTHGFEYFDEAFPNQSGCVRRYSVSGRLCIDRASLDHVCEVADVQSADFLRHHTLVEKTVEDAAVDFLSLWERLQFEQQDSNLQPLHQPQPQTLVEVNALESEDDYEGFWDLRADWYERRPHRQPYSLLRVERIMTTNDVQAEQVASSSSISRRRITMDTPEVSCQACRMNCCLTCRVFTFPSII